jgi:FkbM family methyltransferase
MRLRERLRRLPAAVEVTTDVGELLYPADCQVVTPAVQGEGRWDPADAAALTEALEPGMHVLNIGAHIGYFALLAARLVGPTGQVTAVEPAPDNFALLRANVSRSDARNVRLVNAAAWRTSGTLELSLSPTNTGDHRAYAHAEADRAVPVRAVALDEILGERLDLVFADTQATEHIAIEGMRETIRRARPTMLLEFWPHGIRELGDDPEAVLRSYRSLGYEIGAVDLEIAPGATDAEIVATAANSAVGFGTLSLAPK